jgi:hypothetical protein
VPDVPLTEAMPFGPGATPQGDPTVFSNMVKGLLGMPKHLMDAAYNAPVGIPYADQSPEQQAAYDNLIKASTETAAGLAGTGAPAAEAGAAGIFGGRMAANADLKALREAQYQKFKGITPEQTLKETGWFTGPEGKWRFEIPDNQARMMYPNNSGPAGGIFQHPELYKAYPGMKNVRMFSEVNPNFPNNTGSWHPADNLQKMYMELSSTSPQEARLGALHEFQHVIQNLEGFTPGSNVEAWQTAMKQFPHETKTIVDEARKKGNFQDFTKPYDFYKNVAGEAEARNVERRADFSNKARREVPPWWTSDVKPDWQFVHPVDTTLQNHMIKALRGF